MNAEEIMTFTDDKIIVIVINKDELRTPKETAYAAADLIYHTWYNQS